MAARFKNTGPACCCCKELWPGYARAQFKVAKPGEYLWLPAGSSGGNGDFDHVNRQALYSTLTSGTLWQGTLDVYLRDEQEETDTFVISRTNSGDEASFGQSWRGCVDPDNQRIIDVRVRALGSSTDELVFSVYNYDGTGDTELFTLPVFDLPDKYFYVEHLHYNRSTETVFAWLFKGLGNIPTGAGSSWEIIEFDLLGNPHSVIHSFPLVNQHTLGVYSSNVFVLEIDYTNQKLLWEIVKSTADLSGTFDRKVMRSDWGGANIETLRSETTPVTYSHLGWQYSHKDDCFYLLTNNPALAPADDPTNGLWRVEPDWSDQELINTNEDMEAQPSYFRLGCGYETMGPDSPA